VENVHQLEHLKAEVTIIKKTDGADPVNNELNNNGRCDHCARECGNMYLRCSSCYDQHNVCCDCFFAGRHMVGGHNERESYPNRERAHSGGGVGRKRNLKPYEMRFRWVLHEFVKEMVDDCTKHLETHDMIELAEMEKTIEYLKKHQSLLAIHEKYLKK